MKQGVTPYGFQADILDALTVAMTGLLDGAMLKLLKAPPTLLPNITLAVCDANEADFDGYAAQAVTSWQAAAKGPDGLVRVDSDNKQWLATGTTTSCTVYGVYETNADEDVLQQVWELDVPIVMGVDLLQAVDFTACFYFPSP